MRSPVKWSLMNVRKIWGEMRQIKFARYLREYSHVLAGPMVLRNQSNLRDPLIPICSGDDPPNSLFNRWHCFNPPED